MLLQFAAMLTSLAASAPNITFINGQGTLKPQTSSWDNELHPAKVGFEKFADIFRDKLKALFPSRVASKNIKPTFWRRAIKHRIEAAALSAHASRFVIALWAKRDIVRLLTGAERGSYRQ
jgi:hypothetical protein